LWPWVLLHLCEASLFFGLVALAVRMLRAAPARTRYFFWLAATVKLLFPSVFLGWLLWQNPLAAPVPSPPSLEEPVGASPDSAWDRPIQRVIEPLLPGQIPANKPQSDGRQFPLYGALTLIWLTGSLFLVVRWTRPNLRLARAVRAARRMGSSRETEILRRVRSWLALNREIQVLVSPRFTHAGLLGIRNPVILLPQGATVRLSDEELAAILIHELVHLERRDNLVVLLQRVLTSLLGFYPPTWLIDQKLLEERERACDEEVLRLTQAPETYASGILKVVGACLEGRMAGASSIGGSSFKRRMADILSVEPPRTLGLCKRALTVAFGIALAAFSTGFGLAGFDAYATRRIRQTSDWVSMGTLQPLASRQARAVAPLPGSEVRPLVEQSIRNFPFRIPPAGTPISQIERSPESPIGYQNPTGGPLFITDARMRAMRFKQGGVHLLLPRVSFSSQSAQQIAAVRLELRQRHFPLIVFAEMYELVLKPQDSFSTDRLPGHNPQRFLHQGYKPLPPQNLLLSDPANRLFHPYVIYLPLEHRPEDFTAEIRGGRFANGESWGTLPAQLPSPNPPTRFSLQAPGPDLIVSVDPES
jgi:beta-lactamase regulating signal transducer with metallopeptidase domain